MDTITVSRIRKMAQNMLEQLEGYEDTDKIELVSNTYFLGDGNFIGITGYDGGYVEVHRLADKIVREDDEEW